ncbi:MAG: glycosyl hydrolase 53 family protein [Marinilabiliaceae bacterium]|nr:glycosyl hydrolase 53 family protein [Marinilabiliaceae bacterium]
MCKISFVISVFCVLNFSLINAQNDMHVCSDSVFKIDFEQGVDLSYVKQVEDYGAEFKDDGIASDPYAILKSKGATMVRLRLWHNPIWVRDVYNNPGQKLYSGLEDVANAIKRAKDNGLKVNLDFHYSDIWADPEHQSVPKAWENITSIKDLTDSIYNYTYQTLIFLSSKNLMPEMVQIGNETNCGMLLHDANVSFPKLNICEKYWGNYGLAINAGIKAVRDIDKQIGAKTTIALHVADPKNLKWWFDGMTVKGNVSDFDVIGFSYYPLWHTTVGMDSLPSIVREMIETYHRKVMVLETAYPWTKDSADNYNNLFGSQEPLKGYPFTVDGQLQFLVDLTRLMKNAGGSGVMYWEPCWIPSGMKDKWGQGTSWENVALFDFEGNLLKSADYLREE